MAYQMAATAVALNDIEGHSEVAGLFKCNPSNICTILHDFNWQCVRAVSLRYLSFLSNMLDFMRGNSVESNEARLTVSATKT